LCIKDENKLGKYILRRMTLFLPGLPDFPWYKIPKWGKYTKLPQNIPNGRKSFPMAIKQTK
jgi:hypothetical protein